jgi:PPOX class probable F420-dependent enzyme
MADVDLSPFEQLVPLDHGLSVVVTRRPDGSPQTSVVNAGVIDHPLTGRRAIGFVVAGTSHKLRYLRADPSASVVIRAGWQWATVEGVADLIGPDDPAEVFDTERLRLLLRHIFAAAGGVHDDWDEYDRVIASERRTAVLVTPTKLYSNPG